MQFLQLRHIFGQGGDRFPVIKGPLDMDSSIFLSVLNLCEIFVVSNFKNIYQLILFPFNTSFLRGNIVFKWMSVVSKSSDKQLFDKLKKLMLGNNSRMVRTSFHSEIKLSVKSSSEIWRSLAVFKPFKPKRKHDKQH